MIHKTGLVIIFLSCCILYSCTSGTSIDKNITIGEVKRKVNINSSKITSLDAEGNIFFDTPEESNSAFMTLSIHKPDSLYAKFQGPFGITAGNVFVTRYHFIYYNALDNIIIKGSSTPLNLGAILRIKVGFDDLVSGLSASLKFPDETEKNSQLTFTEDEYVITVLDEDIKRKYWINAGNFYITRYIEYINTSNSPSLEIKYSGFVEDRGKYFPMKMEINRPEASQYVSIDYRSFELNKNKLTFRIVEPQSAKIIIWD